MRLATSSFSALILAGALASVSAQTLGGAGSDAALLTKENVVDAARPGTAFSAATVGQTLSIHDNLRTGEDSRASIRFSNLTVVRVDELTTIEILPPLDVAAKPTMNLKQGSTYFFSRERSREIQLQTPAANGALRGTEFEATVTADGYTIVTMLDGEVELSNAHGRVLVRSGEQGRVKVGGAPTKTAVIEATNIIQWCLYYPGILCLGDIHLSRSETLALQASITSYEQGDLLAALRLYPAARHPSSSAEKVYRAGLLLSVGQVGKAERLLKLTGATPGREALLQLIAAVKFKTFERATMAVTATDWMAESYYQQSRSNLEAAREAARWATKKSPEFAFAWARLAELEFSYGRVPQSQEALGRSLSLAPRNAEAHSLQGYLLSAENKTAQAKSAFEEAMKLDGALANAWLGHGLCLIREGNDELGRLDLQTAAALEPNRSVLHSYLGKAFSNRGYATKSYQEFERAKKLDASDPTPWIYAAIQSKQDNRINEAVRDLETSLALNNNRRVYRSQFLLDQDRAVRSANLAAIYQSNGMEEVSVREATRGVDYDYASASSHLFLANSYNMLRDPKRINLRYETPWFNELLLANLLSPVGGGPLSQYVSEQEYSKLFEANRLGLSSSTDYLGLGRILETASQYGVFGNVSYSLDTEYEYDRGVRPNNDLSRSESYAQAKVQLGLHDSVFFQTKYQDTREGDLFQYYDQGNASPRLRFNELQQPAIILGGYHHEWMPGVHTLLLAGRLADEIDVSNKNQSQDVAAFVNSGGRLPNVNRSLVLTKDPAGGVTRIDVLPFDLAYHSTFVTYTGEWNQIIQQPTNTLILGARVQAGEFHTSSRLDNVPAFAASAFNDPAAAQDFSTDLARQSYYLYDTWRPLPALSITGGFAYDRLDYPANYRDVPILSGQRTRNHISPKAGLIWNPAGSLVFRGAYTRSLGGVSFDESVLLEPTQIAGFNQVFRNIISESVVGSVAAPTYENAGLLIEDKLPCGTYLGLQATVLRSVVARTIGVFDAHQDPKLGPMFGVIDPPITASATPERLGYEDETITGTVNQLIGNEWSLGARYRLSFSDLHTEFRAVPRTASALADHRQKATLHEAELFALYNHASGFFAEAEAQWTRQSSVGYAPDTPGDEFWQLNTYAGYRLRRNLGEVSLGFLNMTDQDYRLNPLNYYNELPRERTLLVRVKLNF